MARNNLPRAKQVGDLYSSLYVFVIPFNVNNMLIHCVAIVYMCMQALSTSIHFPGPVLVGLLQLIYGERQGTPWTGRQLTTMYSIWIMRGGQSAGFKLRVFLQGPSCSPEDAMIQNIVVLGAWLAHSRAINNILSDKKLMSSCKVM